VFGEAFYLIKKLISFVSSKQTVKIDRQPSKDLLHHVSLIDKGIKEKKDYLAPNPVDFSPPTHRKVGNNYIQTLYVWKYPGEIDKNHMEDLYNLQVDSIITFHQVPINNEYFIDYLTKRIDKNSKIMKSLEKRGKSDGYTENQIEMDKELRKDLIKRKENTYAFSFYIDVHADNLDELQSRVNTVQRMLGQLGMIAYNADGENEAAFYSTLPILADKLQHYQTLTTSNIADMFPLSSPHLSMETGAYYGRNKGDNSMILLDRFKMDNPNSIVIGPSGKGKSTLVKQEHLIYWMLGAKVFAIDRDNEMRVLTQEVGGLYIDYSKKSEYRINPCDLRCSEDEEDRFDYFDRKIDFLINLYRKMAGGVSPRERSLLAKSIRKAYEEKGFTDDYDTLFEEIQTDPGKIQIKTRQLKPLTAMPILSDIDEEMKAHPGLEELREKVGYFMEEGPGKLINEHSNVDVKAYSWVTFGVRNLSEETRPVIIWTILDFIENTIKHNADLPKHLRDKIMVIAEEAWSLINDTDGAKYFYAYSKRCRKYGGALTTVFQNILDCYKDEGGYGIEILNNTSLVVLTAIGERGVGVKELKEKLNVNNKVIRDLKRAQKGEGYIITDNGRAEFDLKIIPEFKHMVTASAFEEAS
jgi:conjugal transfer ATP-binding protein TraC